MTRRMRNHADLSREHARCVYREEEEVRSRSSHLKGSGSSRGQDDPCLQRACDVTCVCQRIQTTRALRLRRWACCQWLLAPRSRGTPPVATAAAPACGVRGGREDWLGTLKASQVPLPRAVPSGTTRGVGGRLREAAAASKLRATSERGGALQTHRRKADAALSHRLGKGVGLGRLVRVEMHPSDWVC